MKIFLNALIVCILLVSPFAYAEGLTFSETERNRLAAFTPWPVEIPADPGNEFSGKQWAETVGERLFNDPALSAGQSISCATCHQADRGFAEASALAVLGAKPHVRNTLGLLNIGYQRWFGWDGGADSLWSASLRPILSDIEMASDIVSLSIKLRNTQYLLDALGKNGIDATAMDDESLVVMISKFIGAYMRTLVSGETRFDRFLVILQQGREGQSAYPLSAQRGMKMFFGEGSCFACHFGPNFSNGEFHDIGRPYFTAVGQVDSGRYSGIKRLQSDRYSLIGSFNGTGKDADKLKTRTVKYSQTNFGQWRTPSLRNLLLTAPYMHDGSLDTLRDVVDYYADIDPMRLHTKGESILRPMNWTDTEREDLVDFLETLSE